MPGIVPDSFHVPTLFIPIQPFKIDIDITYFNNEKTEAQEMTDMVICLGIICVKFLLKFTLLISILHRF